MHTYERSVAYPHGHRNVMFAQRGVMTLPRLAPPPTSRKAPGNVHPDDTKMLYRYLHEFERHLRIPHQRDRHGDRLARQRSGRRADRRNLPGGPHVV